MTAIVDKAAIVFRLDSCSRRISMVFVFAVALGTFALADVFASHRQTFARAIRIVPRLIDPIVSRAEQLMCEDA